MNDREYAIHTWLLREGHRGRLAGFARRLGISAPFVYQWVKGVRTSRRVRDFFVNELGCPAHIADMGKNK